MDFINLIKGQNPQQIVMSYIKSNNINDPMINELIQYAEKGDTNSINSIAENFFRQRGQNFGQELSNFLSLLK
jgi:hypothetical protein